MGKLKLTHRVVVVKKYILWLILIMTACGLLGSVQLRWSSDMATARSRFIEQSHAETRLSAEKIDSVLHSIYENLRTLASIPGIRNIDHSSINFSDESRTIAQQIYNNLATNMAISKIYVLPIDFDPKKLNPVTQKPQTPILTFDQFIVDVGDGQSNAQSISQLMDVMRPIAGKPAEIETFEYLQLVDHARWLQDHYANKSQISALDIPFISGSEIITSDNGVFTKSGKESDRYGIVFSVPYYDAKGQIKGLVSTVMLTANLRNSIPRADTTLLNVATKYNVSTAAMQNPFALFSKIQNTESKSIYSEKLNIATRDWRSPWLVYGEKADQDFYGSSIVRAIDVTRRNTTFGVLAAAALGALSLWLTTRNMKQASMLAESLNKARIIAEDSERSAQDNANQLQKLNDDISRLNMELAEKLNMLSKAQDDIVKKGKMAQLGHLVATVAHEIRNPLSGIRNSSFLLQRKLKDNPVDYTNYFTRIETGINRCDTIITQLLDYSRSRKLISENADISQWLEDLLNEHAVKLPPTVQLSLSLPENQFVVPFDKDRLRGGIVNLINNAAEALTGKSNEEAQSRLIEIELKHSERGAEIEVRDNGPGIPAEILAKIGEPLFTTKSFGTGLGIAMVQKTAELHGGGLEIQSEHGKGAAFKIWFPLLTEGTIAA